MCHFFIQIDGCKQDTSFIWHIDSQYMKTKTFQISWIFTKELWILLQVKLQILMSHLLQSCLKMNETLIYRSFIYSSWEWLHTLTLTECKYWPTFFNAVNIHEVLTSLSETFWLIITLYLQCFMSPFTFCWLCRSQKTPNYSKWYTNCRMSLNNKSNQPCHKPNRIFPRGLGKKQCTDGPHPSWPRLPV